MGKGVKNNQQIGKTLGPSENLKKTLDTSNEVGMPKSQGESGKGLRPQGTIEESLRLQ